MVSQKKIFVVKNFASTKNYAYLLSIVVLSFILCVHQKEMRFNQYEKRALGLNSARSKRSRRHVKTNQDRLNQKRADEKKKENEKKQQDRVLCRGVCGRLVFNNRTICQECEYAETHYGAGVAGLTKFLSLDYKTASQVETKDGKSLVPAGWISKYIEANYQVILKAMDRHSGKRKFDILKSSEDILQSFATAANPVALGQSLKYTRTLIPASMVNQCLDQIKTRFPNEWKDESDDKICNWVHVLGSCVLDPWNVRGIVNNHACYGVLLCYYMDGGELVSAPDRFHKLQHLWNNTVLCPTVQYI